MSLIHTTRGDIDDSLLVKHDTVLDNENETTTAVEYCLMDCPGPAHRTGQPDAPHCFCTEHVHRSVSIHLKQGLFADSAVGGFT